MQYLTWDYILTIDDVCPGCLKSGKVEDADVFLRTTRSRSLPAGAPVRGTFLSQSYKQL